MGWQPSASKTEILLLCPRPFDPALEEPEDMPGEPALYGSAFHRIMAVCLASPGTLEAHNKYSKLVDKTVREFEIKDCASELAAHVKSSAKVFLNWLKREKLEVTVIEKAYAVLTMLNGEWVSRIIPPHNDDHVYKVAPGELPGTIDVLAMSKDKRRAVVIDHKTGFFESWIAQDENVHFALPKTVPQLRTLGLAVGGVLPRKTALEVGIFHADRKSLPVVYAEPFQADEQLLHAKAIAASFDLIGRGLFRPGAHCKRCPARVGCPGRSADLLVESAEVLVGAANRLALEPIDPKALMALPTGDLSPGELEGRAGALYDMLKRFRELEKTATAELRRLVKAGAVIETRDGKALTIREQTYETLSKKSVLDALGKVAGEKELARLRKKGLIKEQTREMLIAEK